MITYELAKELRDAGFPQETEFSITGNGEKRPNIYIRPSFESDIACPTLSELIEACGKDFWMLEKRNLLEGTWWAGGYASGGVGVKIVGKYASTPEEVVARLWLALYANTGGNTTT